MSGVYEYGSEFWFDIRRGGDGAAPPHIFWEGERFFASGRSALSYVAENAPPLKRVLLPAYCCGSVFNAFARRGFSISFYDCSLKLEPNAGQIIDLIGQTPCVLVYMGYFGFETAANMAEIAEAAAERGCFVIEDATHSLFTKAKGAYSDCRVASVRKWLGIPSGGALETRGGVRAPERGAPPFDAFCSDRGGALSLKKAYIESGNADFKNRARELFKRAEDRLDADDSAYGIDSLSLSILQSLDKEELAQKRRSNFRRLSDNLTPNNLFTPVFDGIADNVCPLGFPVYAADAARRSMLLKLFSEKGLYCPVHWPEYDGVREFLEQSRASYVMDHIFTIPCDQRYDAEDMDKIVKIIKSA